MTLKRSGFKRTQFGTKKPREEVSSPASIQSESIKPLRRGVYGPAELSAAPKLEYVRSPALLKACREIPCQCCGTDDGTIVAAHSNQARHGKGRSVKASDQYIAALCYRCHSVVDQGRESREERNLIWWLAHAKTVSTLVERGLWPKEVEIPTNGASNA